MGLATAFNVAITTVPTIAKGAINSDIWRKTVSVVITRPAEPHLPRRLTTCLVIESCGESRFAQVVL